MKKWVTMAMVMLGASAFAQDVPAAVEQAFNKKYPQAEDAYWSSDDRGYTADFEAAAGYCTVLYTKQGKWVETRTSLNQEEYPRNIVAAIEKSYPNADIDDIAIVEDAKGKHFEARTIDSDVTQLVKLTPEAKVLEARQLAENIDSDVDEDDDSDDW